MSAGTCKYCGAWLWHRAQCWDCGKGQAGSSPASVLTEQRDAAGSGIGVLTVPHRFSTPGPGK
jgi:hypothetical protein